MEKLQVGLFSFPVDDRQLENPAVSESLAGAIQKAVALRIPRDHRSDGASVAVRTEAIDSAAQTSASVRAERRFTAIVPLLNDLQLEQEFTSTLQTSGVRANVIPSESVRLVGPDGAQICVFKPLARRELPARAVAASPPPSVSPELPQTSAIAVGAFICSVLGLWIVGLPLGIYARQEVDRSQGRLTGRGFATAGIVFGLIGIVGTIILIIVLIHTANHPGCTYTYNATGGCVPGS
jgi:hypothetical protein